MLLKIYLGRTRFPSVFFIKSSLKCTFLGGGYLSLLYNRYGVEFLTLLLAPSSLEHTRAVIHCTYTQGNRVISQLLHTDPYRITVLTGLQEKMDDK